FTLRSDLFAPLVGADLSASLSEAVQQKLRLRISRAEQSFTVAPVEGRRARLLGLKPGTIVLRVQRNIHFAGVEPPALHAELLCRMDRLSFCQTLQGEFYA